MKVVPFILLLTLLAMFSSTAYGAASDDFREQIEADWLFQEAHGGGRGLQGERVDQRAADAAGGCDGIKNGRFGFHTCAVGRPWWQVDLGSVTSIDRVVVWNRCEGEPHAKRASRLMIRLSEDGQDWRTVYQHNGQIFYGFKDKKPLTVTLTNERARFVRVQLPQRERFGLDEIEVFGPAEPDRNLALHQPAMQINASWFSTHPRAKIEVDWLQRAREVINHARRLANDLKQQGADVSAENRLADRLASTLDALPTGMTARPIYLQARWLQRKLAMANPLLDFDAILITQRVPGSYSHMSDQYYGWWSRPGGGIYILRDFRSDSPKTECLTDSFKPPGSFMRPMLSYDAKKVLFAWCRHYPKLAAEKNKLDKKNVPEDAFYHLFEMNIDGHDVRQLTHGKYDDFDARYLPDGRIVFLSTRRGQFIQCGRASAARTIEQPDLPDSYVRCGGGPERPVAVYTLHTMNRDGSDLCAISPFEMFEWTPSVADDGSILYSRWDYIDRDNQPYMSLWAINPDGTNARLVYGNFTHGPNCTFEPRCIPGSRKIVLTGSAHHAQTMGTLVLLDPAAGLEGDAPITRLTPAVPFPEVEGRPEMFYAHPWPLSERFHLVSWGVEHLVREGAHRPPNGMGIYLFDSEGNLELIHRDPEITSSWPIPLRPRPRPPVRPRHVEPNAPAEGNFLLADVYQGLKTTQRGEIKALRIIAVPPKTHPNMNVPNLGQTYDDPGKCVLGTVPVEKDGSAYFRAPAGVIVFFQALDAQGMAVQSMRSATHVQPGQTLSCIGCHESRMQAPPSRRLLAALRPPSKITVGPDGSWPLRFDRLVQPVLDRHCVLCHTKDSPHPDAARIVLTADKAYDSLTHYGQPSLREHVTTRYNDGKSLEGACPAQQSSLLAVITNGEGAHADLALDKESLERLIIWMDTYAQRTGSFSDQQEQRLIELRQRHRHLLIEREMALEAIAPEQRSATIVLRSVDAHGKGSHD